FFARTDSVTVGDMSIIAHRFRPLPKEKSVMSRLIRFGSLVPLALAMLLASSAPALAQSTGTLQGVITDSQNAIMPGVSVGIKNTATGLERDTVTDSAGQYVAASLQPGKYLVTAHLDGFGEQKSDAELLPAQTTVLNF